MTTQLVMLIGECQREAVAQGADPDTWAPTADDIAWIVGALGERPSDEEWAEAYRIAKIHIPCSN